MADTGDRGERTCPMAFANAVSLGPSHQVSIVLMLLTLHSLGFRHGSPGRPSLIYALADKNFSMTFLLTTAPLEARSEQGKKGGREGIAVFAALLVHVNSAVSLFLRA